MTMNQTDQTPAKTITLTKWDLFSCWRCWIMYNLSSMSFERFESFGFCLSMMPVLKKLYPQEAEHREALKRHSSFYNTEPQIGAIINGLVVGLEEKKANGDPIDGDAINTLKVGLMGPIAGIGDSMIPGMLIPILLSIGMALADGGSLLGPIFYIVAWCSVTLIGSWSLFMKGYRLGTGSIEALVSSRSTRVREAISLLGIFVMGGLAASYVTLSTPLQFVSSEGVNITIQTMLDGIFPKVLPLLVVTGTWYLMAKKNVSSVKAMLSLLVVAASGVIIGVF